MRIFRQCDIFLYCLLFKKWGVIILHVNEFVISGYFVVTYKPYVPEPITQNIVSFIGYFNFVKLIEDGKLFTGEMTDIYGKSMIKGQLNDGFLRFSKVYIVYSKENLPHRGVIHFRYKKFDNAYWIGQYILDYNRETKKQVLSDLINFVACDSVFDDSQNIRETGCMVCTSDVFVLGE